jgi:hypothetical protein
MKLFTRISLAALSLALAAALPSARVYGQIDFTGSWNPLYHEDYPERFPGPELGDYSGLPLNAAGRLRADSYDADRISVVTEYQCRPHAADYAMRGAGNLRITRETDPDSQAAVAFHTHMGFQKEERTIWLDDRPHPPEWADHSWSGFSTGKWEGNMLTITTTHLKAYFVRRNGVPRSDKATVVEHWMRHGNYFTAVVIITDPAFLTEPLIRSENWQLDPGQDFSPSFCESAPEIPLPQGTVPAHLPGTNPFLHEVADWYGLPYVATRGGAETMYPEFRQKMGKPDNPVPAKCERYCVCGMNAGACNLEQ